MGEVPYNSTHVDIYLTSNNITPNILDNSTKRKHDIDDILHVCYAQLIISWIIFCIAFPGICFALYKLRSQVASVYAINLLTSDLIQVCANPIQTTALYLYLFRLIASIHIRYYIYGYRIYLFGVQVNILFMMCISAERYVMVAHAVWYRNIQNRKISVLVSVVIWILSALIWIAYSLSEKLLSMYVMVAVLLLPYPLVMFFFVATWRALSRTSVPRNDQIRIRSILGLILCIYTILFIPYIITILRSVRINLRIAQILIALNPLFDLLLYVLLRKDISHVWRTLLFCCNRGQGVNVENGRNTEI